MIRLTMLLIPSLACLLWAFVLFIKKDKSGTQKILVALMSIAAIYFYVDANYVMFEPSRQNYVNLVYLDIIAQFITMSLPPILYMYLSNLAGRNRKQWHNFIMFIPALMLGTVALVVYAVMGIQHAADFLAALDAGDASAFTGKIYEMQIIVCQKIYNLILFAELVGTMTYCVYILTACRFKLSDVKSFLNKKRKASTVNAVSFMLILMLSLCCARILLGRLFLVEHSWISAILSLILAAIIILTGYIGCWFPDRKFSLWDLQHPEVIPGEPENQTLSEVRQKVAAASAAVTRQRTESSARPVIQADIADLASSPSLLESFVSYMANKKPYLNPELNISDVAQDLYTNRTYISVLMNKHFHTTFREYINQLRINESKEILKNEPNTLLEVVAERSGFLSDSQFVKKFKEIEGVSPRAWQSKQQQ